MPLRTPLADLAERRGFRPQSDGESEIEYRQRLSDHVWPNDKVEAMEILFGPWDQWPAVKEAS